MSTIGLSYIIPFYNGQGTIQRVLESIYAIDVDERNFEVIIVDDCSPQPAEEVLNAIGWLRDNLRVVRHIDNKRQGGAKNTGIREARGEYVVFADQDDVVLAENVGGALRLGMERKVDVLSCRWELQPEKGEKCELGIAAEDGAQENGVLFCEKYVDPGVSFGPWSYLYRREYLMEMGHPMAEYVGMEDADWIAWHLFYAKSVAYYAKPIYRWYLYSTSTSHKNDYRTRLAWMQLGYRKIRDTREYRKISKKFADRMFHDGWNNIYSQFFIHKIIRKIKC